MLLSEIFDYLIHGELSHLSIAKNGVIETDDYPKLITNINLGLVEIYKRFPLKLREVAIDLRNEITLYHLHSDYAQSNQISSQPIKYIIDGTTTEPFSDDILLITQVYNELGEELPLNDLDKDDSVFTPTPISLQVPDAYDDNSLSIIYRANPEKINYDTIIDPSDVNVEIYPQFIEALSSYVAWRIFAPLNVGERAEANSYYAKFVEACDKITELGVLNIDNVANLRFGDNGWL